MARPLSDRPKDSTLHNRARRAREHAAMDRATAESAMAMCKEPNALLRLMVAEWLADNADGLAELESLRADNARLNRLAAELEGLIYG